MGRLTGCCCCFNLKDGAKAVGITMLVLGSLSLVSSIAGTVILSQQPDEQVQKHNVAPAVQGVLQIGACILHLVFNALLVHGVDSNRRGMVLAWLIYDGIVTGLQSIAMAILFILACISGVWWFVLLILCISSLVGVFWYWFVVVLHHYQEMNQENGFVYGKQVNEGENHAI